MAKFAAQSIVEPLECTLKPYADWEGVIPEPTTVQVQEFINAQRRMAEWVRQSVTAPEGGDGGEEDLEAQLARMGPEQAAEAVRRNAEMCSALCSGTPSAEDLAKLPYRVFAAFSGWLAEQVLNPEAVAGVGNAQVIPLPSAAAG